MPNRRAAPPASPSTRSRFSKRILAASSLFAIVVVALGFVLFSGIAVPTASGAIGVSTGGADSNSMANATSAGSTTSSGQAASAEPIDTPMVSGVEKVYVSVVEATPQTSDDVNTGLTQSAVQSTIEQLNSYWSTQSGGEVTVVFGGYETRSLGESTCAPDTALRSEESDAFGGMFAHDAWKGTHNHLLVLSAESCNADSFATVGGVGGEIFSGNGIDASTGIEYLLHEFGHNLGFEHADASICTNTTTYDGTAADFGFSSATCPTREYDDYFDIMGYTVKGATPNLSSPQRIMAGWMSDYETLTNAKSNYTETISALGSSGGVQALKIVDPISGDIYYVEYRTDSGLDATSAEFHYGQQCDPAVDGYTTCELGSNKSTGDLRILRVIPFADSNANGTTVLATSLTPGSTDKTKRLTRLDAGNSFTSVDSGFSLQVHSTSPTDGATVSISFGTSYDSNTSPNSSAPTTRIPSKTTIITERRAVTGAKEIVRVTVARSGTNNPTGTIVLYLDGTAIGTYPLMADSKGSMDFTTPRLMSRGSHTFTVTYSGPGNARSHASITVDAG